jgi:acetyl-CoA synthetase
LEQQSRSSYTLYVQQYWSRSPASILPGFKGQAICAFVSLKAGIENSRGLVDELKGHLAKKIDAIAQPDEILFAAELPKARSGKIMRRLLRDIADGQALGDTTTLADPTVVAKLKEQYEEE